MLSHFACKQAAEFLVLSNFEQVLKEEEYALRTHAWIKYLPFLAQ